MSLILLLSDLHLVGGDKSDPTGDHKVGLVPKQQRATNQDMLVLTMHGIRDHLRDSSRVLDAIIVAGDVADKNDPGGYRAFVDLVYALDDTAPPPSRIVVVPGNHDVATGLLPNDPVRYANYVEHVRGAGYVTPLLEGIDPGSPASQDQLANHLIQVDDIEILPLNSSAYAQVRINTGLTDAQWSSMETALADDDEARRALNRLRIVDAARLSERHLQESRAMLQMAENIRRQATTQIRPLRIGVLHHQLLPVGVREEIKAFETITNLALVQQFLSANQIAIVIHGHKHEEFTYLNYVPDYSDAAQPPRAIRVIAGSAPTGSTFDAQSVCRLIEVSASLPYLTVTNVPAGLAGVPMRLPAPKRLYFESPNSARASVTGNVTLIDGEEVGGVYRQLVAQVEAQTRPSTVVCRIGTMPSEEALSGLYPGFHPATSLMSTVTSDEPSPTEVLQLFRELVEWWQQPAVISASQQPAFTHGSRILRYAGHLDQLEQVAEALRTNKASSRGVLVLLNPVAEKVGEVNREFPSFCIAQTVIRREADVEKLDCIAYFRKQEVRYWWLVNIAEIASLQTKLTRTLASGGKPGSPWKIEPGSITTVAALAHAGQSPPKVQVPKIDQYFSREREKLFAMVNALCWPEMPGRGEYAEEWLRVLLNMVPAPERETDGVAVAVTGLQYVLEQLTKHLEESSHGADTRLSDLSQTLERILHYNTQYSHDESRRNVDQARHEHWKASVDPLIRTAIELTYARILEA
jgi:hypothetical protein